LLQRAGDEQAQRIFKAHHRLLREAVESHGGHEVKWLGDGLMVAFDSAADAVKCAIAMQQASRRPTAGERLEIRAGLNVGETLVDESDYFGTPVVVARRLCDSAGGGQIFATDIVTRLLDGRGADISSKELGPLDLKGITNPVPAVEIVYQHDPMALLRQLPFVGRQSEYDTMLKKLSEAANGRGSVVLLAGEPGIGKTRLTEEFCEHASSSATIIRGNCYESDVAAPFGPWVEALRSLTEQLGDDQLRDALGDSAPEIATLLPDLRRKLPDTGEAMKLDPESERARLFDAISVFVKNAAEDKPLVIFLDDLHWCDKPSLLLLEFVARGIADKRIVIVGTYRDMEVDRVHPLAQTLAALRRFEHHERLAIKGFPREEIDALLMAIEPSDESRPVRRVLSAVLSRQTEGNPLFVREVITTLIESGKIVHEEGHWTSHVTNVAELGIPEGIREAIGRRLSRMSEGCNQMLARASAFTSGFTWEELAAISDDPEDDLLDYLDEALGSELIAEREGRKYAFTHAMIRHTLYDELSTPRRVRLHRRVAESLEILYADDIDSHLGELAAHYMASMGGEAEKAIDYSIRAGERAMELVAWEEAATYFRQALDAMPDEGDAERRCSVLLQLGQALMYSSQYLAAVGAYREAAAAARAVDSAELLGEAACGFEDAGYFISNDLEVSELRLELIDEALSSGTKEDSALRARLLAQRSRATRAGVDDAIRSGGAGSLLGHRDPAVMQQAREAVDIADRLGDSAVSAMALSFLAQYLLGPGEHGQKREILNRCVQVARQAGTPRTEVDGWQFMFGTALAQGDMDKVAEAHAEADRLAEETKIGWAEYGSITRRAALALAGGHFSEAESFIFEAWTFGQSINHASAPDAFAAQVFYLRWYQGRLPELEDMIRGVVAASPNVEIARAGLSLILAKTGQANEAVRLLEPLVEPGFTAVPEDGAWALTMTALSETYYRLDRPEGAAELYEVVMRHPDENAVMSFVLSAGAIAHSLGQLATLLERWDNAERHFNEALGMNERMGHRPAIAQTRRDYGDMLLRRNATSDSEKARVLLDHALEAAREMGMASVVADCERLLGQLGES